MYGPRNIDARINQDPVISQQISLWNQQGSRVLRGSLLAIPIDESLIYVQPLYLAAEQGGALAGAPPRRRRLWQSDRHGALPRAIAAADLRRPAPSGEATPRPAVAGPAPTAAAVGDLIGSIQRAWDAWQKAQEALKRGDWTAYGQEQKRLEETLRQLKDRR